MKKDNQQIRYLFYEYQEKIKNIFKDFFMNTGVKTKRFKKNFLLINLFRRLKNLKLVTVTLIPRIQPK